MISSQFLELCDHYHNPVVEHFHHPPYKKCPHIYNPCSGFQLLETIIQLSVYIELNLMGIPCGIIENVCSLLHMASLTLHKVFEIFPCCSMYWWFTHFIAEQNPVVWTYHVFYPFFTQRTFGLLVVFGYYEQRCYKHSCTCLCMNMGFHFSWV